MKKIKIDELWYRRREIDGMYINKYDMFLCQKRGRVHRENGIAYFANKGYYDFDVCGFTVKRTRKE